MYYAYGWPKLLDTAQKEPPIKLSVDKVKILFAVLREKSLEIWLISPAVPITYHRRSDKCIQENGTNAFVEWKVDSSKIVVAVSQFSISYVPLMYVYIRKFCLLTWIFLRISYLIPVLFLFLISYFHSFLCAYCT